MFAGGIGKERHGYASLEQVQRYKIFTYNGDIVVMTKNLPISKLKLAEHKDLEE